jgi:hypothetical protein
MVKINTAGFVVATRKRIRFLVAEKFTYRKLIRYL